MQAILHKKVVDAVRRMAQGLADHGISPKAVVRIQHPSESKTKTGTGTNGVAEGACTVQVVAHAHGDKDAMVQVEYMYPENVRAWAQTGWTGNMVLEDINPREKEKEERGDCLVESEGLKESTSDLEDLCCQVEPEPEGSKEASPSMSDEAEADEPEEETDPTTSELKFDLDPDETRHSLIPICNLPNPWADDGDGEGVADPNPVLLGFSGAPNPELASLDFPSIPLALGSQTLRPLHAFDDPHVEREKPKKLNKSKKPKSNKKKKKRNKKKKKRNKGDKVEKSPTVNNLSNTNPNNPDNMNMNNMNPNNPNNPNSLHNTNPKKPDKSKTPKTDTAESDATLPLDPRIQGWLSGLSIRQPTSSHVLAPAPKPTPTPPRMPDMTDGSSNVPTLQRTRTFLDSIPPPVRVDMMKSKHGSVQTVDITRTAPAAYPSSISTRLQRHNDQMWLPSSSMHLSDSTVSASVLVPSPGPGSVPVPVPGLVSGRVPALTWAPKVQAGSFRKKPEGDKALFSLDVGTEHGFAPVPAPVPAPESEPGLMSSHTDIDTDIDMDIAG